MTKAFTTEQWKTVDMPVPKNSSFKLQVSNLGRLKSFNKNKPNGNIINGSLVNGYPIIRMKLFKERTAEKATELRLLKEKIEKLQRKIKKNENADNEVLIAETQEQLKKVTKKYKLLQKEDEKERVIYYHSLIHRLVAENFLPKPRIDQIVVGHLDFDKLNNKSTNLKWMTVDENFLHQQQNPLLYNEDGERKDTRHYAKNVKLTVTKVMLLKKMLNQGKPTKTLVKQFKITETQISRIKRGENWGDIPAAN